MAGLTILDYNEHKLYNNYIYNYYYNYNEHIFNKNDRRYKRQKYNDNGWDGTNTEDYRRTQN